MVYDYAGKADLSRGLNGIQKEIGGNHTLQIQVIKLQFESSTILFLHSRELCKLPQYQ